MILTANLSLNKVEYAAAEDTFTILYQANNNNADIIDALMPSGVLTLAHGGSAKALTASNGGIVYTDADSFEILSGTPTALKALFSQANSAPIWSTPTYPNTATLGKIHIGDGNNVIESTPKYPNASATAGKVIRSDGTDYTSSTFTIPDTMAINTVLYASSANVLSALATGNSGIFVTSAGGVPSIATDIPTAVTIGGKYNYRADGIDVPVADGGTGLSTVASGSVLIANALNTIEALTWASAGTKMMVNTSGVLSMETVTGTGAPVLADSPFITTKLNLETTYKKALSASDGTKILYVDDATGNDTTGDGTSALPFKTIMKAVNSLPRIVTEATSIYVNAGTYSEQVTFAGIQILATLTIEARDLSANYLYQPTTIATSGGNDTITKTSAGWATNAFANGKVWIYRGTGLGQIRDVVSNTTDTITVSSNWTINPDNTSYFVVVSSVIFSSTSSTVYLSGKDNITILGVQFKSPSSYAIYIINSQCTVRYCFIDSYYGIFAAYSGYVYIYYCFFSIGSSNTTGLLLNSVSVRVDATWFVAETVGLGTGILLLAPAFVSFNNGYFKDCLQGIGTGSYGFFTSESTNTYINCTETINYSIECVSSILITGALNHDGTTFGVYGTTPVVKGAALTAQLTTITHTAPGTPDYALQDLVQNTGFGFVTKDEGNSVLAVIANLQARVAQLEARLGDATGPGFFVG